MSEELEQSSQRVFRAACSCGWTIARRSDTSNLPAENNRRITRVAADAHQFTHEWRDEAHEVSDVSEDGG